jgi:23S rRNA (pseudouridine1915-N3)-methyltransferase
VRYRIVAVGRLKRGFAAEGCEHYRSRLSRLAPIELREVREARGAAAAVREAEGAALLAAAEGRTIALDERGTRHSSEGLAAHLSGLELRGISRLSLLIGGAEGLSEAVRERADELWRLSDLTLPHELARLLLIEQLYRAETIRTGHPYHRGG